MEEATTAVAVQHLYQTVMANKLCQTCIVLRTCLITSMAALPTSYRYSTNYYSFRTTGTSYVNLFKTTTTEGRATVLFLKIKIVIMILLFSFFHRRSTPTYDSAAGRTNYIA